MILLGSGSPNANKIAGQSMAWKLKMETQRETTPRMTTTIILEIKFSKKFIVEEFSYLPQDILANKLAVRWPHRVTILRGVQRNPSCR